MVHDMVWRNRMLVPITRTAAWWKLIQPSYKIDIDDIKGRWYETSLIFQDPFAKAVKNGEGGNGIWMNSRGDATGKGKGASVAQSDRIGAFGASVPKGTRIVEGLEPPSQPIGQQQQSHDGMDMNMGAGSMADPFSIDEFMNVDHLGDDAGMEYGNSNNFTF
jgi:hypothetical protein